VRGEVVDERGEPVAGARVARDQAPTWLLVGSTPEGVAVTDAKGRFALNDLPEGPVTLEAYAPELGRVRVSGVSIVGGRTTDDVRLVLAAPDGGEAPARTPSAGGGVAITLGETSDPVEVVIVTVVEGSEAERAGVLPGDVVVAIDGAAVSTMQDARARLSGPIADDVVVSVRRGEAPLTLRVPREAVRR
jgi:S1-C subfamily serine protease